MKKLVVSPAQAQNQTIAIVITIDVSPCPATAPPRITAVSPGNDEPDERPGLEEGERPDQHVGPIAELSGEVLEQLLDVDVRSEARWKATTTATADRRDQDQPPATCACLACSLHRR